MRITLGDRSIECMSLLGIIEHPFTSEELKTAFRIKLKMVHPDKGGTKEATVKIIDAFNHLKNLASTPIGAEFLEVEIEENEDIFKLWKICHDCHGTKIKIYHTPDRPCPWCSYMYSFFYRGGSGRGYIMGTCKKCLGTGKFKKDGVDKGICYNCSGTGVVKKRCSMCQGTGWLSRVETKKVVCPTCKGKGKIELNPWNPVIPKGAVLKK